MLETATEIIGRMEIVTKFRKQLGYNSCLLEKPLDGNAQLDFYTGIFFLGDPAIRELITICGPERDIPFEYRQILELRIPDRIAIFPIPDEPALRDTWERKMAACQLPSVLLTSAREKTGESTTYLFVAQGINPQTALDELKEQIRSRLIKQN